MTVTPSWPGVTGLATTTDGRKALAGLIAKSAAGVPRSGVFPRHTSALVTARADMNLDVGIFEAAAVQFGGAILFTNDATANLPSLLVSPLSGTNYYVVYAKQNESTSPGTDPNTNRVLGTVLSTSSFTTARASGTRMDASGTGLPTGAVELGTVEIPTGKTATNQAGVIITQTFQYTAAEGSVVLLRNATEEAAWAPHDGALAYRIDTGRELRRAGGAWRPNGFTRLGSNRRTADVVAALGPSWTDVCTVTATSVGGLCAARWSSRFRNAASGADRSIAYRLTVDTVQVGQAFILDVPLAAGQLGAMASFDWESTPAAGSHTWVLQVNASAGSAVAVGDSVLVVEEM